MQITVQNVSTTTVPPKTGKGRPYGEATVEFLNERGETKVWKLRSFTNPSVYKTISEAQSGQVFEITKTKNDKDYDEWVAANPVNVEKAGPAITSSKPTVIKSTYETPEERAVKQRLIVRQSSLAQAIACQQDFLNKGEVSINGILDLADQFTDWVYQSPSLTEMDEDIPF